MTAYDVELLVEDQLVVEGELPRELTGSLVQALADPRAPHPLAGPLLHTGVRLRDGVARWYRSAAPLCGRPPLGPIPALAPAFWLGRSDLPDMTVARPVRDPRTGCWHTVATYPELGYGEHLTAGPDGTVVRAAPFALADPVPYISGVELTERYLVMIESPMVYSRAAALVGNRAPFVARPERAVRVGLLPRTGDAEPTWLPEAVVPGSPENGPVLGPGWVAGRPVQVGEWLLVFGHHPVGRRGAAHVFRIADLSSPLAVVQLPVSVGASDRVAWLPE
ncbi:hypothetical protein Aph01nite_01910 [Acrocarpospora phusangensis]|uniref:Dioxygenase n=1 Tax=Acrocarpospora phusangensis TaxID=1070424 RepID=A0A919Q4B3_9ACTN|nr:carotenoid oxygenase family protein [Acrocarpospora phusangensis]GIH21881.1 hypothetical protein Aph01nite_01910 [Acrocarpospora phusangensis]